MRRTFDKVLSSLLDGSAYTEGRACTRGLAWGWNTFIVMGNDSLFLVEKVDDWLKVEVTRIDNMSVVDILADDWILIDDYPLVNFKTAALLFREGFPLVNINPSVPREKWVVSHPNPILKGVSIEKVEALLGGNRNGRYSYWAVYGGTSVYKDDFIKDLCRSRAEEEK